VVVIATARLVPGLEVAGTSPVICGGGFTVIAAAFPLEKGTPVVVRPAIDARYATGDVTAIVGGMVKVTRRDVPITVAMVAADVEAVAPVPAVAGRSVTVMSAG
jgi:hypothetical protein